MALPQPTTRQQPPVMNQKLRNPPDSATAYNLLFNNMQLFQNGTQHNHYSPQTLSLHHLQEQQRQLQQQQKQKKKRRAKPNPAATVESSSGWNSVPLHCWISLLIFISIRQMFTDNLRQRRCWNLFLSQGDKKFSCQYCDFRSNTSYNVSSHVKSVHSRIKVRISLTIIPCSLNQYLSHLYQDFCCAHCDFKTSKKWNLKSHVRTVHEKVKDFACSACEYRDVDQILVIHS